MDKSTERWGRSKTSIIYNWLVLEGFYGWLAAEQTCDTHKHNLTS
jgi:hypothetical protein